VLGAFAEDPAEDLSRAVGGIAVLGRPGRELIDCGIEEGAFHGWTEPNARRSKTPRDPPDEEGSGRRAKKIPARTHFRAKGTIRGRAGLTAGYGMGTGVTPLVWSPEKRPGSVSAPRSRISSVWSASFDNRGQAISRFVGYSGSSPTPQRG